MKATVKDRVLAIIHDNPDKEFCITELASIVYNEDDPSLSQIKYVAKVVKELARQGIVEYKFFGNKSIVKAKKVIK